jgi:chromate reductase, NAD(P)H dehydrogenase (quinone)
MRAQIALQISLNKLGLLVIPNSFALGLAHQAFDEQRRLKDGNVDQNVRGVGAALVRTAIALAATPKHTHHLRHRFALRRQNVDANVA